MSAKPKFGTPAYDAINDCEARIAQAMATTLDWARDRYRRGNLPADASELAMYLRNDLERRAVNEPASLPKEGP